ncbi:D-3-phosphoglycerate dehydrogenase [Rhodococcus sp. 27YEA15]|uniref:C-terminal binding protein n=1 Tax=Rhodococcus sp. 27YEA15 TaxID=3156259 RepID=UPI003C7CA02D
MPDNNNTTNVVIVDCDHDSIEVERRLADERGVTLTLAQAVTEDDVIAAAENADAIVVQYAPITDRVLTALPNLRAIGRYGVGVDTVDVDAATAHGVAVCNVPDYGTEDVSDHAVALALSVTRGIVALDRNQRRGIVDLTPVKPLRRARESVFGVVGLGLIGAATARKAAGLGFDVIGSDPMHQPGTVVDGVRVVGFDDLLAAADVVSLHVPLNAHTKHLINAESLTKIKSTAVLVNTCRGGVVETAALVDALTSGRLKAAALDVFEVEPLPADHALVGLDNVTLTPHAAWYSEESYSELKRRAIENVVDVAQGRTPRNILNPVVLESDSDSEENR